jgi:hypothetical protein
MRLPTGRVTLHRHRREAAVVTKPWGRLVVHRADDRQDQE